MLENLYYIKSSHSIEILSDEEVVFFEDAKHIQSKKGLRDYISRGATIQGDIEEEIMSFLEIKVTEIPVDSFSDCKPSNKAIYACPECGETHFIIHQDGLSKCFHCKLVDDTSNFEVKLNGFVLNDCGVCLNPERVYYFMPKGALAWAYIEINIARKGLKYASGYSSIGGSSPCSIFNFDSKEEAIRNAIERIDSGLKNSGLLSQEQIKVYRDAFNKWKVGRLQLSLF